MSRFVRAQCRGRGKVSVAVGCGLVLASIIGAFAETIRLTQIAVESIQCNTNLLLNADFEETRPNGFPAGWQWDRRNTDAICVVDRTCLHRGRQSLFITNGTGFGAHVYGTLWRTHPVKLTAGKPYTMSAWVKSKAPGILSLIGGSDWQFRVSAQTRDDRWHRIVKTFTPSGKDCEFTLRINTESVTPGVWIDDLKLEEGTRPTMDPPSAREPIVLEPDEAEGLIQGDGPFKLAFTLATPNAVTGTLSANLSTGGTIGEALRIGPGVWHIMLKGDTLSAKDTSRTLSLRLEPEGRQAIVAQTPIRFFSASNALERAAELRARLPELQADLQSVRAKGQDVSYPKVTTTVLENFVAYVEEDARRGEVRRALEQMGAMESMAAHVRTELKEALSGQRHFAGIPRWTGEKRPDVKSSSFMAPARFLGGKPVERPVFFNGYGHFGQVVTDMEKWPDYGANMIQIELGPSRMFPQEGQTNQAPVREMLRILDRAQKSGVAVCLLISPHYFPDWALRKWPHLRKHRDGFLQYCLHAPEGQELLRQFILATLAPLKDHPALHSICLSNEPVNQEEPCEPGKKQWQAWLANRHGTVGELNSLCGSNFASFAHVPLPNPYGARPAKALSMDYIRYNQDFFAGWHKKLADAVHEAAPGLPVHAKAMTWTMVNDGDIKYGVDATLFGQLSDINGNDSINWYHFGDEEFAQLWQCNALGHDLQRSVLDAPVINTENHLIVDRETRYVPASHIRAALWQAAIHGQSATAIWVWERTFDAKSDFAGSIMHRPACAEAVGIVNYDLNRAALEVAAIQQAPPQVLLLQSVTACVWDGAQYSDCLGKLYTALSFTGLKLGFVTERQLENGLVPDAPVIFVPAVIHFSDAAMAGLRKYKGHLVFAGEGELLSRNEYGRGRVPGVSAVNLTFQHGAISARQLHGQILEKLRDWQLNPAVELCDPRQQPAWGVEWRSAHSPAGTLINFCNYLKQPATVKLVKAGRPVGGRDVLSGERVTAPLTLNSLEVRLIQLDP